MRTRLGAGTGRLARICFGDRTGLVLFVGALLFFSLTMRVDVFINDTNTVLNSLVAVGDGQLHFDRIEWGPDTGSPGMHLVGDRLYGRNYGQVVLSLPFLWLLEAAGKIADLRVALLAGWSLAVIVFFDQLGAMLRQRDRFALAGSLLAVGLFGVNVLFATPLDRELIPLLALQLSTMVAAAMVGVVCYRLVAAMHDGRTGLVAGVAIVLASPVGFWASIPKRHSLTALATVLVLYSFYRARSAENASAAIRFRALAYVWVAVFAWIHAPEAFVLLLALAPVDLATARSNEPRELVLVGLAFLVALLPFLVTNAAISGNPVEPPRLLPGFDGAASGSSNAASSGGDNSSSGGANVVWSGLAILSTVANYLLGSARSLADVSTAYSVFVRSGYVEGLTIRDNDLAIRLSVLESMPVAGGLLLVPAALHRRFSDRSAVLAARRDPGFATDVLAVTCAGTFLLLYWPRLPIHVSFTVRYLHPLYPLAIYAIARLPAVRRVVSEEGRLLSWSYLGIVLVGGQLLVTVAATVPQTIDEAVQLHALLALGSAAILAAWALYATRRDGHERFGAVAFAAAGGITTLYLLLSGLMYFSSTTNYALPLSRIVAEALAVF